MSQPIINSPQTKYISIVPENGEQFNAGQKIIYNIEPSVGYIKKDSFLIFDVANQTADGGRCAFGNAGVHSIIDNINIYSKDTGVLLESLQNYSQWVAVENQYMYDDKTQLNIKEGVSLPCKINTQVFNGNDPLVTREIIDPTYIGNQLVSPVDDTGTPMYLTKRYCIPLRCGIFRHWDDEKLIPVLNFGGLRIELILAEANQVLQQIGCANTTAPITHWSGRNVVDINEANAGTVETFGAVCADRTGANGASSGTNTGGAGGRNNSVTSGNLVQNATTGAGAGATITIQSDGVGALVPASLIVTLSGTGYAVGEVLTFNTDGTLGGANDIQVTVAAVYSAQEVVINNTTVDNCGFAVGNVVKYKDSNNLNAAVLDKAIKSITQDGDNVDIELTNRAGADVAIPNGNAVRLRRDCVASPFKYKVVNTEFRLCQVIPNKGMASKLTKALNYQFLTYDLFLDNIPTASLRHQIPINSVASKSKAIFTSLIVPSVEKNDTLKGYHAGTIPKESLVNDVVYFVNNRLYPLRSYNPQIKNDKVLALNELVKSFKAINKTPLCLGLNKGQDSNDYNQTFLIARELARNNFVFDLRNSEAEIRLGFSGARAEVLKAQTFVFSQKIIQATATGVQVVL